MHAVLGFYTCFIGFGGKGGFTLLYLGRFFGWGWVEGNFGRFAG
jgi:hypothetical protein